MCVCVCRYLRIFLFSFFNTAHFSLCSLCLSSVICHVVAFALFHYTLQQRDHLVSLSSYQNTHLHESAPSSRRKFTRTHTVAHVGNTKNKFYACVCVFKARIYFTFYATLFCSRLLFFFCESQPAHSPTCSLKISTRTELALSR